jgi:glutamate-1-semialdehyde aminotransferase
VAAIATIDKVRRELVPQHLARIGTAIHAGWRAAADRHGLDISIDGTPPLGHFSFEHERSREMHTYFGQEMLERGFLASRNFYAALAHTDADVNAYLRAVDATFASIAAAIHDGSIGSLVKGPLVHTGFARLA